MDLTSIIAIIGERVVIFWANFWLIATTLGLIASIITIYNHFRGKKRISPENSTFELEKRKHANEALREHYQRLNEKIFRPLSKINVTSLGGNVVDGRALFNQLRLFYNTKSIQNEILFPDALLHLNYDFPNFGTDMFQLINDVEEHNKTIDEFETTLEQQLISTFSVICPVTINGSIEEGSLFIPLVVTCLTDQWSHFLHNHIERQLPLAEALNKVQSFRNEYEKTINGENEALFGYHFWKGVSCETKAQILNILDDLVKDQTLLQKMVQFEKNRLRLLKNSKDLAEKCHTISERIDNGIYETEVACCQKAIEKAIGSGVNQ
ncbi:hypothetical protein ES707_19106 [subsurface metagenome]